MIKMNMFRAGYSDSFLVQVEKERNETINIMIDYGFSYKKKRLNENKVFKSK
jgi:hypothetical protein